ncbi:MAG: hypothetical protein LAO04_00695 [Acidobacteriia bacterium]|nr:hypothetical protein [Terriglobia bacterium]
MRPLFRSNLGAGHAAAISNAYHPAAGRTLTNNLSIWWMSIAWDAAAHELKEFWPDIRCQIHKP